METSNQPTLVNRVANSGLVTINLELLYPKGEIVGFDIKDHLFMGLILKEKEFREAMVQIDWKQYEDKNLCIWCSTDAIIPVWAYMLVTMYAQPFAQDIYLGAPDHYLEAAYRQIIANVDVSIYQDARIVVKGCSDKAVPASAYLDITARLLPIAKSIFYGEPCSTVPIYKKPKG